MKNLIKQLKRFEQGKRNDDEGSNSAALRLPYGIAKSRGIDTKGLTPSQVWRKLKGEGVDPDTEYKKMGNHASASKVDTSAKIDTNAKIDANSKKKDNATNTPQSGAKNKGEAKDTKDKAKFEPAEYFRGDEFIPGEELKRQQFAKYSSAEIASIYQGSRESHKFAATVILDQINQAMEDYGLPREVFASIKLEDEKSSKGSYGDYSIPTCQIRLNWDALDNDTIWHMDKYKYSSAEQDFYGINRTFENTHGYLLTTTHETAHAINYAIDKHLNELFKDAIEASSKTMSQDFQDAYDAYKEEVKKSNKAEDFLEFFLDQKINNPALEASIRNDTQNAIDAKNIKHEEFKKLIGTDAAKQMIADLLTRYDVCPEYIPPLNTLFLHTLENNKILYKADVLNSAKKEIPIGGISSYAQKGGINPGNVAAKIKKYADGKEKSIRNSMGLEVYAEAMVVNACLPIEARSEAQKRAAKSLDELKVEIRKALKDPLGYHNNFIANVKKVQGVKYHEYKK